MLLKPLKVVVQQLSPELLEEDLVEDLEALGLGRS